MMKVQRNKKNQTMQFKLEYGMFFRRDAKRRLCQLPINSLDKDILNLYGATLKLDHN